MKNILITGGTGTLGSELVRRLNEKNLITVLSRDEKKLVDLRAKYPKVKIIVGDIRRPLNLHDHMPYNTIFHCAALKHVDIGESFPDEFFETNYIGTKNVFEFSQRIRCRNFVFFSTDKAVLPINAYGYSKAMAEKYLASRGDIAKIYRWGNIIGSRGSVIPSFIAAINQGDQVFVTDERMTRFWLTIDEAIDFVVETHDLPREKFNYNEFHDEPPHCYDLENPIIHPNIKSSSVLEIVDAICEILGKKANIQFTKIRPGEKIHECLRTGHDYCIRSDNCDRYSKAELKEKLKKYIESMNT